MDIVFMGSPDFAIPSLEKLYHSEHTVKAVVSNIDKRRGRGSQKMPTPVKKRALELDLPVIEMEDLRSESFARELAALNADLFVVVAFRILPPNILALPEIGSVNLHASLLPRYRGAAPIHWAVINGEKETGCTIFFLDERVDTGQIIMQKKTEIGPDETTGDIYHRLMQQGSDLLLDAVNAIASGDYELTGQDDQMATPAPKLFREDCHINFNNSARAVHNKIRGLSPFPTAWASLDGKKFNIYASSVGPDLNTEPGRLLEFEGKLLAGCGEGTVELNKVQLPGTKKLNGEEFLSGYGAEGVLE